MGKNIEQLTAAVVPTPVITGAQQGYQDLRNLAAVNSLPTNPGPARPLPPSLTMPSSLDDAKKRMQDAFTAVRVMKAVNDGNNQQVLSTLKGRQ